MDTFLSPPPPPPPQQHSTFSLENISPSVFIITIIIASTIILSISLCFLLRLLRHKNNTAITPETRPSPHANTASTNNTLLSSLPLFTFSSITQRRRRADNNVSSVVVGDCAVCLSKFEEEDKLRLLPLCCHAFHAECIDTWLVTNESCPICRAGVRVTEAELMKVFGNGGGSRSGSFRLELGSVSRRRREADEVSGELRSSYSIGSFDYVVEDESEVTMSEFGSRVEKEETEFPVAVAADEDDLAAEVGGGRSWLKDYVDRLSASISSRTESFRSSGRFFTGSSRRNDVPGVGDYDLEANRIGEEISELFRWFSAV